MIAFDLIPQAREAADLSITADAGNGVLLGLHGRHNAAAQLTVAETKTLIAHLWRCIGEAERWKEQVDSGTVVMKVFDAMVYARLRGERIEFEFPPSSGICVQAEAVAEIDRLIDFLVEARAMCAQQPNAGGSATDEDSAAEAR